MYFNMDNWSQEIIDAPDRRFLPVLFFPCLKQSGVTVREAVNNGKVMGDVMKVCIDEFPEMIGAMTGMDLTIDAEAFGAKVLFKDDQIPSLQSHIVETIDDAKALQIPDVHAGRQDLHVEAVKRAQELITDRPIFGGMLGTFSLVCNLYNIQKALKDTKKNPEMIDVLCEKATDFLIQRALEYKSAGANGILLAEPTAGLLPPDYFRRFSTTHVKRLVDAVQDSSFYVVHHDCANVKMTCKQMYETGAKGLHFGDAVNMRETLSQIPRDVLVFGNLQPAALVSRDEKWIYDKSMEILEETKEFENFVFSSGCDIPPDASVANIHAMINAMNDFNKKYNLK
ncbi:MAG: uroporphyrinogen decarboxylase family protein [Synergistes sp.]|nr:uroporphyrinogen decarboxylase family protein [Synergistes sp.]